MERIIMSIIFLFGISGCCSYRNTPLVSYHYQTHNMVESLVPGKGYSIYEYTSPFVGVADREEHLPAHYQILLPQQKDIRKIYGIGDDRCFIYSKARGIAIFQELAKWAKMYENGLREISTDEAEGWISKVETMCNTRIKVKNNRHHYLYVDNEIRIVMFNLCENDYDNFVEFPLTHLRFYQRGKIMLKAK